ncbi:MAG: hypothetical protein V3W41_16125 [Planctomycetota bacterium]
MIAATLLSDSKGSERVHFSSPNPLWSKNRGCVSSIGIATIKAAAKLFVYIVLFFLGACGDQEVDSTIKAESNRGQRSGIVDARTECKLVAEVLDSGEKCAAIDPQRISEVNAILRECIGAEDGYAELRLLKNGTIRLVASDSALLTEALAILTSAGSIVIRVVERNWVNNRISSDDLERYKVGIPRSQGSMFPDLPTPLTIEESLRFRTKWGQILAQDPNSRDMSEIEPLNWFRLDAPLDSLNTDSGADILELRGITSARVIPDRHVTVSEYPMSALLLTMNKRLAKEHRSFFLKHFNRSVVTLFRGFIVMQFFVLRVPEIGNEGINISVPKDGVREVQFFGALRIQAMGIRFTVE